MRKILPAMIVCLSSLTAACELNSAHQAPNQAPRPAVRFGVIDRAPGPFVNTHYGFVMSLPPAMGVDSLYQRVVDSVARALPDRSPLRSVHSWAFMQLADPHDGASAHVQQVLVNVQQGRPFNERVWTMMATAARARARKISPEGEVVEYNVRWRSDTSEYRVGVHDFAREEFRNIRCLGTHEGRPHTVIVCVQTVAPTAETLAGVRESLTLTAQQDTAQDK